MLIYQNITVFYEHNVYITFSLCISVWVLLLLGSVRFLLQLIQPQFQWCYLKYEEELKPFSCLVPSIASCLRVCFFQKVIQSLLPLLRVLISDSLVCAVVVHKTWRKTLRVWAGWSGHAWPVIGRFGRSSTQVRKMYSDLGTSAFKIHLRVAETTFPFNSPKPHPGSLPLLIERLLIF